MYIKSIGLISPLGQNTAESEAQLLEGKNIFSKINTPKGDFPVAQISGLAEEKVSIFRTQNSNFKSLDRATILSMMAAEEAVSKTNWKTHQMQTCGLNAGSSRGATGAWESAFANFTSGNKTSPLASPTTTLGNIASWTAQHIGAGLALEHSITCSTALHGLANAMAWLKSGMADRFVVSGSESCLTPFTLAQFEALRIYSKSENWPCQPFNGTRNTMVLGEGACALSVDLNAEHSIAKICGIGLGTEPIAHATALSADGICLQKSMQKALDQANLKTVDAIVAHAPGTRAGDKAELAAIDKIFNQRPQILSPKWQIGHTFGASGAFGIWYATVLLAGKTPKPIPYPNLVSDHASLLQNPKTIMVNAVGFGGNAVSVIISK